MKKFIIYFLLFVFSSFCGRKVMENPLRLEDLKYEFSRTIADGVEKEFLDFTTLCVIPYNIKDADFMWKSIPPKNPSSLLFLDVYLFHYFFPFYSEHFADFCNEDSCTFLDKYSYKKEFRESNVQNYKKTEVGFYFLGNSIKLITLTGDTEKIIYFPKDDVQIGIQYQIPSSFYSILISKYHMCEVITKFGEKTIINGKIKIKKESWKEGIISLTIIKNENCPGWDKVEGVAFGNTITVKDCKANQQITIIKRIADFVRRKAEKDIRYLDILQIINRKFSLFENEEKIIRAFHLLKANSESIKVLLPLQLRKKEVFNLFFGGSLENIENAINEIEKINSNTVLTGMEFEIFPGFQIPVSGTLNIPSLYFIKSILYIIRGVYKYILSLNLNINITTLQNVSSRLPEKIDFISAGRAIVYILSREKDFFRTLDLSRREGGLQDFLLSIRNFQNFLTSVLQEENGILFSRKTEGNEKSIYFKNEPRKEVEIIGNVWGINCPKEITKEIQNFEKSLQQDFITFSDIYCFLNFLRNFIFEIANYVPTISHMGKLIDIIIKDWEKQVMLAFNLKNLIMADLREILPLWTDDEERQYLNNFWFEWECGKDIFDPPSSIFCFSSLTDSEHFKRDIKVGKKPIFTEEMKNPFAGQGIPKDGLLSPFPYILFSDPSLGKSIMVSNISNIGYKCGETQKIDLWRDDLSLPFHFPEGTVGICELNYILAYIMSFLRGE